MACPSAKKKRVEDRSIFSRRDNFCRTFLDRLELSILSRDIIVAFHKIVINFYHTLTHYLWIAERSMFSGVFHVLGTPVINMSAHAALINKIENSEYSVNRE